LILHEGFCRWPDAAAQAKFVSLILWITGGVAHVADVASAAVR
jgi:hypothetical protein